MTSPAVLEQSRDVGVTGHAPHAGAAMDEWALASPSGEHQIRVEVRGERQEIDARDLCNRLHRTRMRPTDRRYIGQRSDVSRRTNTAVSSDREEMPSLA